MASSTSLLAPLNVLLWRSSQFIDSFCNAEDFNKDFKNWLGGFTPCFTDVVVLGAAHCTAIILCALRLGYLYSGTSVKYRLCGRARAWQVIAIIAAVLCLVAVLLQLNARLAAQSLLIEKGPLAPFEWIEYGLTLLSWLTFVVVFATETRRYATKRVWLVRFPLVLIFAGELAKLRFVVDLAREHDYFFWLYITYVGCQLLLVLIALFQYPRKDDMEMWSDAANGYLPLTSIVGSEAPSDTLCPEYTCGFFSKITFSWVAPLMVKGYKAPLQFEDVWKLPPDDSVESTARRFEQHWQEELGRREGPSLTRACWRTSRSLYLTAIPFKLANDASQFVGPFFLNLLLGVVAAGESPLKGYSYAGIMLVGLLLGTICDNQHFQRVMRAGFRLRGVLVRQVFRKVLYLTPSARNLFSSGRIFNLVTSDAETIQMLSQNILGLISSPLRIIGAMAMLYLQLGPSSLVALLVLILMMPVQAVMVRLSATLLKKALQSTDERAKLEGELVGGIDVVKCNAWEDSFWERINEVRQGELAVLWKSFVVSSVNMFLLNAIPTFVSVATFAAYILLGNDLTAAKAFTSLSLFTVLRMPLFQLPQLISQLVNARVAMQRLQAFLSAEEQPAMAILAPPAAGETAVRVEGEFTWDLAAPASLVDIHLDVKAGSFLAIVGPTGSGKSCLVSAALGLMQQVTGAAVEVKGKVAYVPQAAFIYNATIRDNVLFGLPYEEERYAYAVENAALVQDLSQLPAGDMTELGERGVNVSGGQKQRISIARALYSHPDVVFLDDPLSALDAKVAQQVYSTALMGAWAQTTRVLVTNQLQFARAADQIVYMLDGRIAEHGTYAELMAAGKGFASMMSQAEVEGEEDHGKDGKLKPNDAVTNGHATRPAQQVASAQNLAGLGKTDNSSAEGNLTTKESRSTGIVSMRVLGAYIKAMGGIVQFSFLMLWYILTEVFRVATTVWLSHWTSVADLPGAHKAMWYLGIYAALSLASVLFEFLRTFIGKLMSTWAANSLHNSMLQQLLRAPMSFFHTTPLGRIINRLSKDTSEVDRNLMDFAAFFLRSLLQLASTIFLIGAVTPFALPAIVPIMLFFYFLYAYFQASVREIKRLDSISRSPVYSSIGEAIGGLPTIRAYCAEERLTQRSGQLIDDNLVMSLINMSMNRWLSIRLEGLGSVAAFAAAVLAVEQRGNASTIGLTLSYALQITQLTSMAVRLASLAENSFNAVERIEEYCDLPQEAPKHILGSAPPDWPASGQVSFSQVQMRYRPGLPLVLKGLTVNIPSGTKCGVVGRTGAGKSSLINAMFRLMELDGGTITVDGLDIAKLGVQDLRASMAIIPQVPVLFTGTMRFNLDPFQQHSDAEVWAALRRSHLDGVVDANPLGLGMVLSEGGAPLSAGQKQLVALARALLRHSKILVLDEATANVDVETDALIQRTVRTEFADCTLIAIAHRLHTIMDCDLVVVMDHGLAAEQGTPAQLLSKDDGIFTSMVHETGEATERFLRSVAFGEIDARQLADDRASEALEKMTAASAKLEGHTCTQGREMSLAVLEKARGAADRLHGCLATLEDAAESRRMRQDMGIEGSNFASVEEAGQDFDVANRALSEAMVFVDELQSLAVNIYNKYVERAPHITHDDMHTPLLSVSSREGVPEALARMESEPVVTPRRMSLDSGMSRATLVPGLSSPRRNWARLRGLRLLGLAGRPQGRSAQLSQTDPSLCTDPNLV